MNVLLRPTAGNGAVEALAESDFAGGLVADAFAESVGVVNAFKPMWGEYRETARF